MWNEIKNEIDIENLMKEYCGFHDSCIVSINYHSGAFVDDNFEGVCRMIDKVINERIENLP